MASSPLINQPAHDPDESFSLMARTCYDLVFPYHMHPGYQLNYVVEGKGTRTVGDHTEDYGPGDLVLIGPNLPHYWTYDKKYLEEKGKGKAIIIHFNKFFAGADFINKPAVSPLVELMSLAGRGLSFYGHVRRRVVSMVRSMEKAAPINRLVILINILTELSQTREFKILAGPSYETGTLSEQEIKIKRIIHFMTKHFNDNGLSLDKLAAMAAMSSTSFSKYFKKQTGQNYIELLTGLRLSNACKLLNHTDLTISQVAGECGYYNLSNFNRLFKKQYSCSPRQFLKRIKGQV